MALGARSRLRALLGCGQGGPRAERGEAEAGQQAEPSDAAVAIAPETEAEAGPPLPDGLIARPERTGAPVQEDPGSARSCPEGMLLISGEYCPFVGHRCVDWIDEKADRCAKYAPPPLCEGHKENRRFLHRSIRISEPPRREARGHVELVRGAGGVPGRGKAAVFVDGMVDGVRGGGAHAISIWLHPGQARV